MKRLSLIAIGFDEHLASLALESNNYNIDAAVEYCQKNTSEPISPIDEFESPESPESLEAEAVQQK